MFYGAFTAREPEQTAQNFREVMEFYSAGKIDPLVGQTYPLSDYAEALRCLSERRAIGKVVVEL